jgi:hypothetical protein
MGGRALPSQLGIAGSASLITGPMDVFVVEGGLFKR